MVSGERVRNWNLIRAMSDRGWRVSLFGLLHGELTPTDADWGRLREACDDVTLVPFSRGRSHGRLLVELSLQRPFHNSFFATTSGIEACGRWLEQRAPDVVVLEAHYMAPYVPDHWLGRTVFDTHNSETRRLETMASTLGHAPRGVVARLQRRPVARFEKRLAGAVSRVVVVSNEDREFFEPLAPGRVDVVPNGVDCAGVRARLLPAVEPEILFLGSLDYSPNVDAVNFLVDEIAPRIAHPGAKISIVGSHPRLAVHEAAKRSPLETTVVPNVPDTEPYWAAARCLVVPLRMGGGTRLKIVEALAHGVPVVSTSLGCEGLGLRDNADLLVADPAPALATLVDRLLADDELCRTLAANGRKTVERRFDWRELGASFERSLREAAPSSLRR
jgi:glycosyltransferase involved in cell wall biosynthesis